MTFLRGIVCVSLWDTHTHTHHVLVVKGNKLIVFNVFTQEERRWLLLEERKQKEQNSPIKEPEEQVTPQRLELDPEPKEQPKAGSPPKSPEVRWPFHICDGDVFYMS